MLWLGIGATIGANVAYGAGDGLLGALISAWPAVAFIGTVEIAAPLVRGSRGPRAATSVPAVSEDGSRVDVLFVVWAGLAVLAGGLRAGLWVRLSEQSGFGLDEDAAADQAL
jgi:hypothetical protein